MGVYDAISAAKAAKAASETAQQISAVAERHAAIRAGIGKERREALAVAEQGYRLDASNATLAESEQALGAAADALQSRGPAAVVPHLDKAQAKLAQAVAQGSGAPALRDENARRLAELDARGQADAAQIAEGRVAFDAVDEFAASAWSDIKGNGSEAQAAADRAHKQWEQARAGNSMEAQAFYESKQQLDATTKELDYVDQLIDAILTRLKDLEAARAGARGLLAEAERSIASGLEFVRANDPDVGKLPEGKLREASQQLASAQAEAGQPKPDWLRLAAAATAADRLADEALVGARSEAEQIQKLRKQAEQLRPLVAGEVNKIAKYVNLHDADIAPASLASVKALVGRYEQAEGLARRAAEQSEEQRRTTLEALLAALVALQQESQGVFQTAAADVERLEQLRAKVNEALTTTRNGIAAAEAVGARVRGRAPGKLYSRLKEVSRRFDQIHTPITGEANLNSALALAESLREEATDIANDLRAYDRNNTPGAGPIIVAGNIGGWGGSGGWSSGGGSSGPSWGGSHSSGGSFGGGSSGGSFGGGSSGGGW